MVDESICENLDGAFPEGPPTDAQVRAQEVEFWADHWLKRWPEDLTIPDFLEPGAKLRVSRQDLFDYAQQVDSAEDTLAFYVWIAGWGTGTGARAVGRSAQVLNSPNVAEHLWKSFSTVHDLGAVEAYRCLYSWEENRIKYFGPAFFTKWLYFSSYDSWSGDTHAPLILDSRVAAALGCASTGWSATDYGQYLETVEEIRQCWVPNEPSHVVEYALFRARGQKGQA